MATREKESQLQKRNDDQGNAKHLEWVLTQSIALSISQSVAKSVKQSKTQSVYKSISTSWYVGAFLWHGMNHIRILDHSDHGASMELMNPWSEWIRWFLLHHDPSDLGSLIRIQITLKDCTVRVDKYFRVKRVQQISDVKSGGVWMNHYSKQGELGF